MKLVWAKAATRDLRDLRHYSTARWGRDVATHYIADLRDAAKALAVDARRARPLGGEFSTFRVRSHFLGVTIDEAAGILTVVRVLHVTMDLDRHLP